MNRWALRSRVLLTDTGPLVAMVNQQTTEHLPVMEALRELPNVPLLTTWPCLTEAMYLLHRDCGHTAQEVLWGYVTDELVLLHDLTTTEQQRMRELMVRYADTPMDLADASLVVVAESLGLRQVFTLDDDFYLYRLADGTTLEVIP